MSEEMMGLFDQLAGQVMGSLGAQSSDGAQQPGATSQSGLLDGILGMIEQAGGFPALLQQLQASGLADQVASWVGTGPNQPVSGAQIQDALGEAQIGQIAEQAGIDPEQASSGLAGLLPGIIDQLTPGGAVPHNDLLMQGLNLLKGRLLS
jgi:uncharacterized protein YidB (DUF937 family)